MEVSDIEQLLVEELPSHFGLTHRVLAADLNMQEHQNEDFSFNDKKACRNCIQNNRKSCTIQEVAKFHVGTNKVLTIDIENVLTIYSKSKSIIKERCDLLHVTENLSKFVLNELTCSNAKYVEPYDNTRRHQKGKRDKAQKQMEEVAKLLNRVPAIKSYIDAFGEKIALFSWRDPLLGESTTNVAEESMQTFGLPLNLISNIKTLEELDNGFTFVQQLYPAVYNL